MSEHEQKDAKVSMDEIDDAFRETSADKPRPDISNIVATILAIAAYGKTPLDGIRHILESILMIPPENWEIAGLDLELREKAARMRTVCYSLIDFRKLDETDGMVSFPFDPDDADLYLSFFKGWNYLDLFPHEWRSAKASNNRRYYLKLLTITLRAGTDLSLCDTVKIAFIDDTTTFTFGLIEKLFRKYISSTVWEQAMGFIIGGHIAEK